MIRNYTTTVLLHSFNINDISSDIVRFQVSAIANLLRYLRILS